MHSKNEPAGEKILFRKLNTSNKHQTLSDLFQQTRCTKTQQCSLFQLVVFFRTVMASLVPMRWRCTGQSSNLSWQKICQIAGDFPLGFFMASNSKVSGYVRWFTMNSSNCIMTTYWNCKSTKRSLQKVNASKDIPYEKNPIFREIESEYNQNFKGVFSINIFNLLSFCLNPTYYQSQ